MAVLRDAQMESVPPPSAGDTSGPRRSARRPLWRVLSYVPITLFVIGTAVVLTTFKPYRIVSGSMAPTADTGTRVFADHVGDAEWRPTVGDIIVFRAPGGARDDAERECALPRAPHTACLAPTAGHADLSFVKRVVGLPGDRIRVAGGHVIRNGRSVDEPYARSCAGELCEIDEFTVPAGGYFVLGDNRGDSSDSRSWGPVSEDEILGRVVARYWPPRQIGAL